MNLYILDISAPSKLDERISNNCYFLNDLQNGYNLLVFVRSFLIIKMNVDSIPESVRNVEIEIQALFKPSERDTD